LLYTIDCTQLLRLRTVMRLFEEIREAEDPTSRSEIVREVQLRLTSFFMELKPLSVDQLSSRRRVLRSASVNKPFTLSRALY
jgi:hypothetical protein